MSRWLILLLVATILSACASQNPPAPPPLVAPAQVESATDSHIPDFEHIVVILFENEDFKGVIGNADMPFFNKLAKEYTLLTDFSAVRHPSLPNYIALIGGDTFGITKDCTDCFVNAPNLADLIESSGRSWKAYQEGMPWPCYMGNLYPYAQKHNPFVYFDSIRLDKTRCERSVVPLTDLDKDIKAGTLPNFIFITPNLCHDAHDCDLEVADSWLEDQITTITPALDQSGLPYLIVLAFDEGTRKHSFLGLQKETGGQIPVVLISPAVKTAFQDGTQYNHYSLLKTVADSWGLAYLGHAKDESNVLITAPWK